METLLSLWTFPAVILSSFIIAWAAETAQFFMAQGLALAILAFLQTLPEFAVEATIAWNVARGDMGHEMVTANFTGSIRLLTGFALPLTLFINYVFGKNRSGEIKLDKLHSVNIIGIIPPILYFVYIYFKGTLNLMDSLVLLALYFLYMGILKKLPPEEVEELDDLPWVSRKLMMMKTARRLIGTFLLFLIGGGALFLVAEPFLKSLQRLSLVFGISAYFFVQWISPFLTEFPEKVSIFNWARQNKKAPMSVMNIFSSNLSQWTLLVAMIPIVYCLGRGHIEAFSFDKMQKMEIFLTIAQGALCFIFFLDGRFGWVDGIGLFALWIIQFLMPSLRYEITIAYFIWIAVELILIFITYKKATALGDFVEVCKKYAYKR